MIIKRKWAMPNRNTFSTLPIGELINRRKFGKTIDPFANDNKLADITNDLDTQFDTDYHTNAIDFFRMFESSSVDTVLFDPYSPRQITEVYKKLNKSVNMQTTQASFWGNLKKEIGRIVRSGGVVITCGWNSGGVGKKYGFEIDEILLVPHGGWHNDTIVTVETRT